MMRVTLVTLLAMAVVSVPTARGATVDDDRSVRLEREVQQAERERVRALLKGDADGLDPLLSDDYQEITYRGQVRNKHQMLEALRLGGVHYDYIKNNGVEVRLYGNTAVLTGITMQRWEEASHKRSAELWFSRVWVKQAGHWRLVLQQWTKTVE